jgi:hypothetical protein
MYHNSQKLHSQTYSQASTPPYQDQLSAPHYIPQQLSGESRVVPMLFELHGSRQ